MRRYLCLFIIIFSCTKVISQEIALKSSATLLLTATPNLEVSYALNKHYSVHFPVAVNPFVFGDNSRFQQVTFHPGARYWFQQTNSKYFVSGYGIFTRYHVGGWMDNNYRKDGWGCGIGLGGGYSLPLNTHLHLEMEFGLGLIYANYDKCGWQKHSRYYGTKKGMCLIPSKWDISVVYIF